MTDRSITECYFSNPTEINHFAPPKSFSNIKIEDDDYLLHSPNREQKNIISNLVQENNSLTYYDSLSNCEAIIPNLDRSQSNCGKMQDFYRFSLHKDNLSRCSIPGFPEDYSNLDSFSQIENICNEKQPFGEEDSISFNDYSLLKDTNSPLGTLSKNKASNFIEKNASIDNPSMKIRLGLSPEEDTGVYDSRSSSEIIDLEKYPNFSKKGFNFQLLLDNKFQHHSEQNDSEVIAYPFDNGQAEVSSINSTPYKENKIIKAFGLHQSNSKSLQDISKVFSSDVKEANPCLKKHEFTSDNWEMKANNTVSLEPCKISSGTTINSQRKFNANNSGNLESVKIDCSSLPVNRNALNKAKSISLHSLQGIKKSDYSHIQSKVKSYIKNLKQKHKEKRFSETKSLPSTPIKCSDKLENDSAIHLDEKVFVSLTSKNNLADEELPENLRILKSELLNGSENMNNKFGIELFEALLEQVKCERHQRIQQDLTLHKLQRDYNNLLAKYAQAENIIDKLRIFSGSSEISTRDKNYPINVSGVKEPITNSYCTWRQKFPKHQMKKAFSTSNIFHDPVSCEGDFVDGPLVKYSSSPIIDPNISITIQMKQEPSKISMNMSKNKSLSLDKVNSTSTTHPYSSYNENDTTATSVCAQKYEALFKKLREFAVLESKLALQPGERDMIWNYLKKLYNEFFEVSISLSSSMNQKQLLQNLYDGFIYLSSKYNLSATGLSLTDVTIPTATVSTLNNDYLKKCQETMCNIQSISHRRMSLPIESSTSQSFYDTAIFHKDHFKASHEEKELAQENKNDSFDDSCQEEGLINNPCLLTSSTPVSNQLTEDMRLKHTNRYSCETTMPFFMQECSKSVDSTSLKNRIAQYKAKDNDSGCPPSDRSARNSPTFSFSQWQRNPRENLIDDLKCPYDSNYSTPQSSKYFNLVTSSKNDTNVNNRKTSWQKGYDASSSSPDDESFFENKPIRNKRNNETNNLQEDSYQIVKKLPVKSIKKYEDKYVCGNLSSSYVDEITSPYNYRQSTKNCMSPIIQLEKKSSLLKSQMDGLKVKHWKQSHNKGSSLPASRLQPIKPVCESSIIPISSNYDHAKCNFKHERHAEIIDEDYLSNSEDDIQINCHRIISKKDKKVSSPKRKVVCKGDSNPKQNLHAKTSKSLTCNDRLNVSSTQKKSNLVKAQSLNFADLKFDALKERSKSISSITQPIIYIEHYNCCDKNHKTNYRSKICDSKNSRISNTSLSNISKSNKRMNFLGSLKEATSLAENIQMTSATLLERIREDSLLRK